MSESRGLNVSTLDTVTIGTRVEIHNVHLQTWIRGFQVAAIIGDGYLVRRLSDHCILPRTFGPDDIRTR
jgi:hypothetical protein